jgi:GAF domain-containing protein
MLKKFQDLFIPNSIQDEELRAEHRMLQLVLIIVFIGTVLGLILDGIVANKIPSIITLGIISALLLVSFILLRFGYDRFARFIVPASLLVGLCLLIWEGDGTHDITLVALVVNIIIASLTLGPRAAFFFALLSSVAVFVIRIAELQGWLVNNFSHKKDFLEFADFLEVFLVALFYFISAGLQRLLLGRLNAGLYKAQRNAEAQVQANTELRYLHADLEARTLELERANKVSAERTAQLRTVAEISPSFASLENLEELLPKIAERISKSLNVYHVGIYLIDTSEEYAVLRASNSEGGKRMLERGHRIKVGQTGIIGYVCAFGKARIALDVGNDAFFAIDMDLPETRSELVLPLKLREKTTGVLDVQSTKQIAFTNDDIDILNLLAGQVAVTIQNARLFEETQRALLEAQTIYGQSARTSWREFTGRGVLGFSYTKGIIKPLERFSEKGTAVDQSSRQNGAGETEMLSIPIKVRDEELGLLNIRQPGRTGGWSESEMQLYRAIVERLSFALENARLIEETTKNAERDRAITEISDKLGSSPIVEEILRTAAEELSRALKGTEVLVQLQSSTSNGSQAERTF